jgi:hypothetical protein
MAAGLGGHEPLHATRALGSTRMLCPPRLARAFTVKRTAALAFPAGCADTIRSEVTVNLGPPIIDRTQARWEGSTVCAAALVSLLASADQNARTTCPPAVAWAGESVPDTRGGLEDPAEPAGAFVISDPGGHGANPRAHRPRPDPPGFLLR